MNKTKQSVRSISGQQSQISASNSSRLPQLNSKVTEKEKLSKLIPQNTEMDRVFLSLGCDTGDYGNDTEEK